MLFLAIHPIAEPAVESNILGKQRVGVEPHLAQVEGPGDFLCMRHQRATVAPASMVGRDCDVDDQQVVSAGRHLNQRRGRPIHAQQVYDVVAHCRIIVGDHRSRLPPQKGHPFRVGRAGQVADDRHIGGGGAP